MHPPAQRTPLAIYSALTDNGDYKADPEQRRAVGELDRAWVELNARPVSGWWAKFRGKQRLPVTEALNTHTLSVHVDDTQDFRLRIPAHHQSPHRNAKPRLPRQTPPPP